MRVLIIDTETTGLRLPDCADLADQPYIIELAMLAVNGERIVDEWQVLAKPPVPISDGITKITGLSDADVADAAPIAARFSEIQERLNSADFLIAHNAKFDCGVLLDEAARSGVDLKLPTVIDTVCEFQHLQNRRLKLVELFEIFTGEKLSQSHRALDDCRALHRALCCAGFWSVLE